MNHYSLLFNNRRMRNYNKSQIIKELEKVMPKGSIKVVSADDKAINGIRPTLIIFDELEQKKEVKK